MKPKQPIKETVTEVLSAAGGAGAAIAVQKVIKPKNADSLDVSKPLQVLGGLGLALFGANEAWRAAGLGMFTVGALRVAGGAFPELVQLSGVKGLGCGCSKGLGCGAGCGCKSCQEKYGSSPKSLGRLGQASQYLTPTQLQQIRTSCPNLEEAINAKIAYLEGQGKTIDSVTVKGCKANVNYTNPYGDIGNDPNAPRSSWDGTVNWKDGQAKLSRSCSIDASGYLTLSTTLLAWSASQQSFFGVRPNTLGFTGPIYLKITDGTGRTIASQTFNGGGIVEYLNPFHSIVANDVQNKIKVEYSGIRNGAPFSIFEVYSCSGLQSASSGTEEVSVSQPSTQPPTGGSTPAPAPNQQSCLVELVNRGLNPKMISLISPTTCDNIFKQPDIPFVIDTLNCTYTYYQNQPTSNKSPSNWTEIQFNADGSGRVMGNGYALGFVSPVVAQNIEADRVSIKVGETVNLKAVFKGLNDYSAFTWDFGDGETLGANGGSVFAQKVYYQPSTYIVSISATNPCDQTITSKTINIEVLPANSASVVLTGPDKLNVLEQGTFVANIVDTSCEITQYRWEFPSGETFATTENFTTFSSNKPGINTIKVCAWCGQTQVGCDSKRVEVIDQPPPLPPSQSIANWIQGNQTTKVGSTEQFCLVNGAESLGLGLRESAVTYTWNDLGATTLDADCVSRTFDTPGVYTLEACYYTENGFYAPKGYACHTHTIVVEDVPKVIVNDTGDVYIPPSPPMYDNDGCIIPTAGAIRICCTQLKVDDRTIVTPPPVVYPPADNNNVVTPPPVSDPPFVITRYILPTSDNTNDSYCCN